MNWTKYQVLAKRKTKGKLLGKYGSVKGVKEANLEDLQALVGKSKGEQLSLSAR